MNVEPTVQPITFKSKPENFSNVNGWINYVNDQTLAALRDIGKSAKRN